MRNEIETNVCFIHNKCLSDIGRSKKSFTYCHNNQNCNCRLRHHAL